MIMQKTTVNPVSIRGIGLHSGERSSIEILPAKENSGIFFVRNGVKIPALAGLVSETSLCTTLEHNSQKVKTIEHLMAAIAYMGIDNLEIRCSSEEIPILDGSALPFIFTLQEAGIRSQREPKKFLKINKPVEVWEDDKIAVILPSEQTEYNVEIDFKHPSIGNQKYILDNNANFKQEIAKARTFGFLEDIEKLKSKGLILGGSVDNAIVLDKYAPINDLRFSDEFVRHKVLDTVGDLRLLGNFIGKFYSYKGGHALNNKLSRQVINQKAFEIVHVEEKYEMNQSEVLLCMSV
jgi:UDP-3-O-[3-hydroxymyristoyl] N-acetylglucosamine deacetylase